MALSVVTVPQPPMTTNVDAVYAPDLSTRSAPVPWVAGGRLSLPRASDWPRAKFSLSRLSCWSDRKTNQRSQRDQIDRADQRSKTGWRTFQHLLKGPFDYSPQSTDNS